MSACLFVCLFVLYSRPHYWTDGSETRRESGHWAGIDVSESSNPIRPTVCQIFTKKHPIFFSFAHNTNQVIGLKSILSLQNLDDNCKLTVRVRIKELYVHSALMNHISSNFSKMYQNHSKSNLMKLSFPMIYHLLKSDTLNVPDENMVLSFLFNYHSEALDVL